MSRAPKKRPAVALLVVLDFLVVLCAGCGSGGGSSSTPATAKQPSNDPYAKAELRPVAGSRASGTAVLKRASGRYSVTVDVKGLAPTRGAQQYALWQLEAPRYRVALDAAEHMVALATYRVGGSGHLEVEFEPPLRAYEAVPDGRLTDFLITRIDSPERLQESIVEFDETGKPPHLGAPVAEGTFKGPLVGAAAQR